MKRMLAVAGAATAMVLAGCGQPAAEDAASAEDAAAPAAAEVAAAPAAAARAAPAGIAAPAAPGAPAFAVIYPGGQPKAPPTLAQGPAGPGGMIEFITDATPEQVVDFYRQRAESAGLKTINTLNRDGVRGYGAGDGADGAGKLVNVMATPVEGGGADVALMWSNGR